MQREGTCLLQSAVVPFCCSQLYIRIIIAGLQVVNEGDRYLVLLSVSFTFCCVEEIRYAGMILVSTWMYILAAKEGKVVRGHLKCDGTRAETRFRLSAKRTSSFKSAGASIQSTTDSRGVRISGSNAGYTMFRGSVKGTGYPLHSPVSPSLPLPALPCAITFQLESTVLALRNTRSVDV